VAVNQLWQFNAQKGELTPCKLVLLEMELSIKKNLSVYHLFTGCFLIKQKERKKKERKKDRKKVKERKEQSYQMMRQK
jgi:hypothetical protein